MDFVFAKKFQEPPQLSDPQPFHHIDMLRNRAVGLVGERGSDDCLYTSFARSRGENFRVNAVARDDSEKL